MKTVILDRTDFVNGELGLSFDDLLEILGLPRFHDSVTIHVQSAVGE